MTENVLRIDSNNLDVDGTFIVEEQMPGLFETFWLSDDHCLADFARQLDDWIEQITDLEDRPSQVGAGVVRFERRIIVDGWGEVAERMWMGCARGVGSEDWRLRRTGEAWYE